MQVDGVAVNEQVIGEGHPRQDRGHEELAGVVLPPVRESRHQRQDGDQGQEHAEGNNGENRRSQAGGVMLGLPGLARV